MEKSRKIIVSITGNLISFLVSLIVILPLVVLFLNSFKTSGEANRMNLSLPKKWVFENYMTVVEKGKLFLSFLNGVLYAAYSVVIIVILVSAAAFAISRNQKGIILLYAAINIPLSLFLSYGFVATILREIDEAAVIDGCSPNQLFARIIVPLLKPIMSTVFVLEFMTVWSDFTMPLYYLNNSRKWPMTLAVYSFFGAFENSWNLVAADIILTLTPVLIVFVLGQKYIIGGVSAGSVK